MLSGCEWHHCVFFVLTENNVHHEEVQGQEEDKHVHHEEVRVPLYIKDTHKVHQ